MAYIHDLKVEIRDDPATIGYQAIIAGFPTPDDANDAIARELNKVRNGVAYRFDTKLMDTGHDTSFLADRSKIWRAVDPVEFAALTTTKALMVCFSMMVQQNFNKAEHVAFFSTIFTPGGPTMTAIAALATRQGSRAEVLFGEGFVVTGNDVHAARRSS